MFSPSPPSPFLDALTDNTALSLSASPFTNSDLCWGWVRRLLSLNQKKAKTKQKPSGTSPPLPLTCPKSFFLSYLCFTYDALKWCRSRFFFRFPSFLSLPSLFTVPSPLHISFASFLFPSIPRVWMGAPYREQNRCPSPFPSPSLCSRVIVLCLSPLRKDPWFACVSVCWALTVTLLMALQ